MVLVSVSVLVLEKTLTTTNAWMDWISQFIHGEEMRAQRF